MGVDALKSRERRRAFRVPCPHCGANVGQRCTVQGRPLENLPAHWARMDAAPGTPAVTRQELVAMAVPPKPEPSSEETAA